MSISRRLFSNQPKNIIAVASSSKPGELAAEGNELHEFASAKLDEIETLFKSYLEKEFDETVSRQRAVSVMLHIFGLRVYGYQKGSAERMRQGLREGLPWLPWK